MREPLTQPGLDENIGVGLAENTLTDQLLKESQIKLISTIFKYLNSAFLFEYIG